MKSIMMQFSVAILFLVATTILVNAGDPKKDYIPTIDVTKNNVEYPFYKNVRDGNQAEVEKEVKTPKFPQDDKDNGLVIAALAGRVEIAKLLLANGANIQFKRPLNGYESSPLRAAIKWASVCHEAEEEFCKDAEANNVVKLLLENKPTGANAKEVLSESRKYLIIHEAAKFGFLETIKMLVAQGKADVTVADSEDKTTLHYHVGSHDDPNVIKYLLANGVNINAIARESDVVTGTALHYAADKGFDKSVKYLLQQGADRNLRNNNDETPLDIAEDREMARVADLLRMCYVYTDAENDLKEFNLLLKKLSFANFKL